MKKVAVMLPANYKGGSLRAAKNLTKSIAYQARKRGEDLQVIFSYVAGAGYDLDLDFSDLVDEGIALLDQIHPGDTLYSLLPHLYLVSMRKRSNSIRFACPPMAPMISTTATSG